MSGGREAARLRAALVRVTELLEDGAPEEALTFARAAAASPQRGRNACPHCGLNFCWPGERDHHLQVTGCAEAAA